MTSTTTPVTYEFSDATSIVSIGKLCYKTMPCQHDVSWIDPNGVQHDDRFRSSTIAIQLKTLRQWMPSFTCGGHTPDDFEFIDEIDDPV
jgi:hypothetical protein